MSEGARALTDRASKEGVAELASKIGGGLGVGVADLEIVEDPRGREQVRVDEGVSPGLNGVGGPAHPPSGLPHLVGPSVQVGCDFVVATEFGKDSGLLSG
jgi:hypothetical protein